MLYKHLQCMYKRKEPEHGCNVPLPNMGTAVYDGMVGILAWMRMMGAESVGYHERTVLGRGDDPVASALDYYAACGRGWNW
jgi:hypothetical protein